MSTDTALSVAERVANGVGWLDANHPGWWRRIDVNTLSVSSPCNCIIGQAVGNYHQSAFGGESRAAWLRAGNHGFNDYPPADLFEDAVDAESAADYAALEAEWKRVIAERREAAKA